MEVSNEYLVGSQIISNNITNSLSIACRMARIYPMLANEDSESIDLSSFEIAPKKPIHKNIHIHKLAIMIAQKATSCKHSCNPIYNFHSPTTNYTLTTNILRYSKSSTSKARH
jgi:hypothetical protein